MKKIALASAMLVAFAGSVQADTFTYSYEFDYGGTITGSFDGTASGDLVTGLSNITATFQGVTTGGLFNATWTNHSTPPGGDAVASFSGTNNDFVFTDFDVANAVGSPAYSILFYIVSKPYGTISPSAYAESPGNGQSDAYDVPWGYNPAKWSLVNVSAVPEPESYALMLAGLGVIGSMARHRKVEKSIGGKFA